jgi:preprotein translocase subunit SecE
VARQTRSQRRARREAREASAGAASAPPRRRASSQSVAPAGDGGTSVEAAPKQQREGGNRLFRFIGESYAELKKVDWPTQSQVITGTTVVLIACLIVGFYLYINDEVWKRVVQHIFLR